MSQCGLCVVCASCRDENFVDRIRDQKSRKANQFLGSMEPAFSRRYPSVTTGEQQVRHVVKLMAPSDMLVVCHIGRYRCRKVENL